ncbi:hypothetical protein [Amycolatopsis sp. NPDC054798]
MARAQHGTTARAKSRTGLLPLAAGILSAVALTGAAYATVEAAACTGSAQYIRHDNHIELVGGCVSGAELPATTGTRQANAQPENSKP